MLSNNNVNNNNNNNINNVDLHYDICIHTYIHTHLEYSCCIRLLSLAPQWIYLSLMSTTEQLLKSKKIQEENLKQIKVLNARKEIACLLLMNSSVETIVKMHG